MSKTVATYLSKDIQEDWDALCKNCGLESPSDILRYAIKKAAQMKSAETSTMADLESKYRDMGLPELEQEYKKLNDKGKQSLQDKKNGVWHYDKLEGEVVLKLNQVQKDGSLFEMPIEIGIDFEKCNQKLEKIQLKGMSNVYRIKVETKPVRIDLDPNLWVLMNTNFQKIEI